ncbi:ATP-binding protein, partial [Salmonella sp. NW1203]|uniref:ATP-binding protein n=1 Tax=unclassified Salmonella TaxID=2614656 RepID=UPI003F43F6BA
ILRGVRQQQDEPGRFSICSRQAAVVQRDSDCVNVMITNTMSGQVPANLERLFDRFYRADSSRFYNTEGAGLGLSITRSIIHAHGGELSAEQQGREIVFKVRLLMD